jgi:hypothetical protein
MENMFIHTQENQSILDPNIKGIHVAQNNKNTQAYPFPTYPSLFNPSVRVNILNARSIKPMMPKSTAINKSTTKTLWRRDKTPSVRMMNANALENHNKKVSAEKPDEKFTTQNSSHIFVRNPKKFRCCPALEAKTPSAILSSYIIDTEAPRGNESDHESRHEDTTGFTS